ncbi:MAG: AmmeMemoRadiSam system protein B [Anaerolineales bacterium]
MDLRPSPIAGRWYPSQAPALAAAVDQYLSAAQVDLPAGEVVGLLAPHAGHVYSGPVAAYAFRAVRNLPVDVVAILCPSHFHDDAPLLTSGHAAYATPLGEIEIDREAIDRLREEIIHNLQEQATAALPGSAAEITLAQIQKEGLLVEIRRDREHAIEIELPFLQRTLAPGFTLIPIMLREQSGPIAHALGLALAKVLHGRRALVIASSDLSHYYPAPIAKRLDAEMLRHVDAFDPAGVLAAQAAEQGLACGYGAIAATLWATRELGATQARVLKHATSGDVSGDDDQVVGYGAAVIWKE